jgi:hypothetical protein
MSEKGISGSKSQAVGEAEEGVSNNSCRRACTKSKGRKEPTETTVVRKKSSVYKPMGKATRMVYDPPMGKVAEVTEVIPVKGVTPKVSSEVPSMTTPMPTKSPCVSRWRNDNKEDRYTDNDELFHIPLLRYTRGG